MENSKKITQSKTCQASVVAGILGILTLLRAFGIDVEFGENQIVEIVAAFGIIISAGVAIYGRIVAEKRIE